MAFLYFLLTFKLYLRQVARLVERYFTLWVFKQRWLLDVSHAAWAHFIFWVLSFNPRSVGCAIWVNFPLKFVFNKIWVNKSGSKKFWSSRAYQLTETFIVALFALSKNPVWSTRLTSVRPLWLLFGVSKGGNSHGGSCRTTVALSVNHVAYEVDLICVFRPDSLVPKEFGHPALWPDVVLSTWILPMCLGYFLFVLRE